MGRTDPAELLRSRLSVTPTIAFDEPGDVAGAFTRMDMHAHSRASDQPVIPAIGVIGCPECYSPPERVYEQARARGMDLVTLTDHDTIAGALELHERGFEGFVIGEEATVYFPEDRCKLHVLVWGHTPAQHEEMIARGLKEDVYAFAHWLRENTLAHALAHPLYVQNGRFNEWHLERCALLFRAFETLNGAHSGAHRTVLERWMAGLTPARVEELAARHRLAPLWARAWLKGVTGGSDDHALLNVGQTWTGVRGDESAPVTGADDFLRRVMAGKGVVGGQAGHSALLAHQVGSVAMHYAAGVVNEKWQPERRLLMAKLARFAGIAAARPGKAALAWGALKRRVGLRRRRSLPIVRGLRESLGPVLAKYPDLRARLDAATWSTAGAPMADHARMAAFAQDLAGALTRFLTSEGARAARAMDKAGVVDALISYGILTAAQAPYVFGLFHQNKERNLLERLEHESAEPGSGVSALERPMRVSLFTDTLGDVNGVCRFIQNVAEQALVSGRDLQVITSTRMAVPAAENIFNFEPAMAVKIPRYDDLEVVFPPLLKIMRHLDRHQPDAIHVSTPGPVGLIGFVAARMLRVPVVGVHHTDFPAYIDRLFEDETLTKLTEKYMEFFYGPFHTVFTRSDDYVESLVRMGVARAKTRSLTPGVDVEMFNPRHKDPGVWARLGAVRGGAVAPGAVKALYVGRISSEKNMPMLERVWKRVHDKCRRLGVVCELILVGDGPFRQRMEASLEGAGARFLGFRHGDELSRIYASSDFFVFTSTTDTLGQVVLESQASGIPVVVTDKGGPKEVVDDGLTGFVVASENEGAWVDTIVRLIVDGEERRRLGRNAHLRTQRYSLASSFEQFWAAHVEAWHAHLATIGLRKRRPGSAPSVSQPPAGVVRGPSGRAPAA